VLLRQLESPEVMKLGCIPLQLQLMCAVLMLDPGMNAAKSILELLDKVVGLFVCHAVIGPGRDVQKMT
jgi:hypothetical protein